MTNPITLWVIRDKVTGFPLPCPPNANRGGRGGSLVEPTDPKERMPRFFFSERAAKAALGMWLKGKWVKQPGTLDWQGVWGEDSVTVQNVPSRIRENMEIVPVSVTI